MATTSERFVSDRSRIVVWIMHVQDGQFCEAWACVDDQYALDRFLNSIAGSLSNSG